MSEPGFSSGASADFAQALEFYLARDVAAAIRFQQAVEHALSHIARDPLLFAIHEEGFRRCRVKDFPYSIIYENSAGMTTVVAIAHSSREPDYWKKR